MTWKVVVTHGYEQWFRALSDDEQVSVLAMMDVLEIFGPHLARPYADKVVGSRKVGNLKELRVQHAGRPYRVFYAFDPFRRAVLLCGGRKDGSGDKDFYKRMIALAEREFLQFMADISGPARS